MAWGIGHGVDGGLWHNGSAGFGTIGTHLAHGVAQGAISQLRGGKFKAGFVGAIIGGLSPATRVARQVGSFAGAIVSAVFGGLAAVATGGRFGDGAMAAVMRHLFNEMAFYDEKDAYGQTGWQGATRVMLGRGRDFMWADPRSAAMLAANSTYNRSQMVYYGSPQAQQDIKNGLIVSVAIVAVGPYVYASLPALWSDFSLGYMGANAEMMYFTGLTMDELIVGGASFAGAVWGPANPPNMSDPFEIWGAVVSEWRSKAMDIQ